MLRSESKSLFVRVCLASLALVVVLGWPLPSACQETENQQYLEEELTLDQMAIYLHFLRRLPRGNDAALWQVFLPDDHSSLGQHVAPGGSVEVQLDWNALVRTGFWASPIVVDTESRYTNLPWPAQVVVQAGPGRSAAIQVESPFDILRAHLPGNQTAEPGR